ncbi:MAG: hypothetical protein ABSC51_08910 [Gaiellaceae bacterium]|jgi:ATP phosphoribosyltransferase regulatory subunit HisZ
MKFECTWIEPSLVVVRTSGPASAEGFNALFEELASQPGFGYGVRILSDHTNLDVSGLRASDIEKIAEIRARHTRSMGARSALVVGLSAPARYGLARMFEAYAGAEDDSVRVFETFDEALTWLRGSDTLAPPRPSSENGQTP